MPDVPVIPDAPVAPSLDDLALSAFDKGLEAAAGGELPEEDVEPDAPIVDEAPDGGDAPVDAPVDAPAGEPVDKGPDAPADKPVDVPVDHATEIANEITERGLKGKTAERFTELATANAELRATLTELKAEKLSDVVERLNAAEQRAIQWEETVTSTGATPQQFGNALGYLQLINSRDPLKMKQAYDAMAAEQKWLAGELGLAAGDADPLDVDPALKKRVIEGDVPRDVAEALVQTRAATKLREENTRASNERTELQRAQDTATQEVAALGASLRAQDPANFDAKLAVLTPSIRLIQQNFAPSRWVQEIEKLYRATTVTAPRPAPVPKIGAMPLRPTGGNPSDVARKPKNDLEAFDMGIEEANRRLGNR
jgi:hypothetical protein